MTTQRAKPQTCTIDEIIDNVIINVTQPEITTGGVSVTLKRLYKINDVLDLVLPASMTVCITDIDASHKTKRMDIIDHKNGFEFIATRYFKIVEVA